MRICSVVELILGGNEGGPEYKSIVALKINIFWDMADLIPNLVPIQFLDRTGRSSHRLQVTEQNRYLKISQFTGYKTKKKQNKLKNRMELI